MSYSGRTKTTGEVKHLADCSDARFVILRLGPIWMNINYLIVRSLYKWVNNLLLIVNYTEYWFRYGFEEKGPYAAKAKEIYTRLRENLVNNVIYQYFESGYLWEQ